MKTAIKVAMVGAGGVGKTTIASRLVSGTFIEHMMTVGLNIETWSVVNEATGATVRSTIFDIAGQSQFRFFQPRFLLGTEVVLIVVDVTSPESLYNVDEWLQMVKDIPKNRWIVVANKIDGVRAVSDAELSQFAAAFGAPVCHVSAKTGEGFDKLIQTVVRLILTVADA